MSDNRQHGGSRKGAGRKPAPDGTAKVPYGTKLAPIVVEYLRQRANGAETIETAIKRSKDFRDWRRTEG
jgi:hypothetical protein